jgi:hypothetical protein
LAVAAVVLVLTAQARLDLAAVVAVVVLTLQTLFL